MDFLKDILLSTYIYGQQDYAFKKLCIQGSLFCDNFYFAHHII